MSMRRNILAVTLSAAALVAAAAPLNAQVYYTSVTPRGWLGISFSSTVTSVNGARSSAVIINDVTDDSPAKRAGVQKGDTLLRVNDFRASSELLGSMGSSVEPGDTVRFVVKRNGREHDIAIVVAERPANMTYSQNVVVDGMPLRRSLMINPDSVRGLARLFVDSMYATLDTAHFRTMMKFDTVTGFRSLMTDSMFLHALPGQAFQYSMLGDSAGNKFRAVFRDSMVNGKLFELAAPDFSFEFNTPNMVQRGFMLGSRAFAGADLADLSDGLGEYFGAREGVLVMRVPDGTPADRAGLEAGDVITRVGGTAVSSVKELREAVEKIAPRAAIKLNALRHGKSVSLELRRD